MSRSTQILAGALLAALPLVGDAQPSTVSEASSGALPTAEGGLIQLVRNKESMVDRLLGESPLARRILESNHVQAVALYREAQKRFQDARAHLATGSLIEANTGFDAAMQAMHQARKSLPDAIGGDAELQVRFGGQLQSIESLRRSYTARFFAEIPAGGSPPAVVAERLAVIDADVTEARRLASEGRVADGLVRLQKAERQLMEALQDAIGADTIEYSKQGRTPEQVYRDELGRNQSFVELVPIAMGRLNPGPEKEAALRRQLELSAEARRSAERIAEAGKHQRAIHVLQRATADIEDLLRESGLAIPRDPGE